MRLGSVSRVGALLAAACAASCAEPTPQPPQLGNCVGTPDAACTAYAGSGGGGGGGTDASEDSGLRGDAARTGDSGVDASGSGVQDTDASAICGQADSMLAGYPGCAACIASPPSTGGTSCCAAYSTCTGNGACLGILTCAIGCASGASCTVESCASFSPLGVTNFNDLAQCIQHECTPLVCPPLTMVTAGDQ